MALYQKKAAELILDLVVLGGDTPYALPLILDLEKKGYIVLASVSTPEAVHELESKTQGYVKALVLDPFEVGLDLLQNMLPISSSSHDFASPLLSLSSCAPSRQLCLASSPSRVLVIPMPRLRPCHTSIPSSPS